MQFVRFSRDLDNYVGMLLKLMDSTNRKIRMDFKRAFESSLDLVLIANTQLEPQRLASSSINNDAVFDLYDAWASLCNKNCDDNVEATAAAWQTIDHYCVPTIVEDDHSDFLIRRLKSDSRMNQYCLFLPDKIPSRFPIKEIQQLAHIWQVSQHRIPIHASAVIHKEKLIIFGGPSGAGKTTIAKLCRKMGATLLDQDQVVIKEIQDGSYTANAWGYSTRACQAPIQAIFKISKSSENKLERLSQTQTAAFLMKQSDQIIGTILRDEYYQMLFESVCKMARNIPGYRMQFTKDLTFWDLIQEALNA